MLKKLVAQLNKSYPKPHSQNVTSKPITLSRDNGFKNYSYCEKLIHMIDVCLNKNGLPPCLKKMNLALTIEESHENTAFDLIDATITDNAVASFTVDQHKMFLDLI